ncbi:hypothetical protein SAMN04489729_4600 [Amycolatopsis lurida]|nr:hypothetical protein SAMN04489729_4600 [Amycolatopsis lurida]
MVSVEHRREESNPLDTVLETVPLPKLADRELLSRSKKREAARIGFPMGGSLTSHALWRHDGEPLSTRTRWS